MAFCRWHYLQKCKNFTFLKNVKLGCLLLTRFIATAYPEFGNVNRHIYRILCNHNLLRFYMWILTFHVYHFLVVFCFQLHKSTCSGYVITVNQFDCRIVYSQISTISIHQYNTVNKYGTNQINCYDAWITF